MRAEAPGENWRQGLQLAAVVGALSLRWVEAPQVILACTIALLLVLIVVPRVGESLYRPDEPRSSAPIGLVLYPATLLLLVVLFWSFGGMPHVTAAIWGLFACGDAAATLMGRGEAAGLPWNPKKSWHGSFAYWVCGSVSALFLLGWVGRRTDVLIAGGPWVAWSLCIVVGGLCAFLESLPVRHLNDNFWVPLVGGVALYTGLLLRASFMSANLPEPLPFAIEAAIHVLIVSWAWTRGLWGVAGWFAALAVGAVALLLLGAGGYLALVVLAVIAWRATEYNHRRRLALELAGEEHPPRWSGRLVVASTSGFLILGFLAFSTGVAGAEPATTSLHTLFATAAVGALAGVAAAVLARELGPIFGRAPVLATTLKRVAAGTGGAISLEGTLIGAAGALVVGLAGAIGGLAPIWVALPVCIAGTLGSHVESFVVASISTQRRPGELALLSLNTTVAGLAVILLFMLVF
ncbi:MAG: hypothetical protein CME06_03445 [Gemmatimonadetes bacterium]|nr:hypothetical protein [Gemmatimonadota bacterium]